MRVPRVRGSGLKSNGPFWAHYVRDLAPEPSRCRRKPYLAPPEEHLEPRGYPDLNGVEQIADYRVARRTDSHLLARLDQIEDDSGPMKVLPGRSLHRQDRVIKRAHLCVDSPPS